MRGVEEATEGWWQHFWGENLCQIWHLRGLEPTVVIGVRGQERAIWERSGLAINVGNPLAAIAFIAELLSTTCQRQLKCRCGITNLDP